MYIDDIDVGTLVFQTPPNTFVEIIGFVGEKPIFGSGFARCQKEDQFNSRIGTILALKKAVDQIVEKYFDDDPEKTYWGGVVNQILLNTLTKWGQVIDETKASKTLPSL